MATQSPSTSSASRVLDRIAEERFTGILRVSAHEASGEFWFLAGILDEGRFGVSKGDEARDRLLRATQTKFQAELRLPHVTAGFKKPMPASGSFADFRPVVLMRHCESCALTCSLELKGQDRTVRLTYRIGELTSVESAAGNDALPALLESDQGTYEFSLPTFELPEGVDVPAAAVAPKIPLAERVDRLLADESSAVDAKRKADEAAAAEAKRKADEAAAAEAKRKADEAAAAEAKRKADEAAAAEAKRKADEAAAAEAKRKADEAKRKAEAAAAEAKRKAEEAKRKAEEAAAAEAKRKAEEAAAEAKRKADEEAAAEAKRKADEEAAAEAKRKADEEAAAEAKRKADEEAAAAEAKRKVDEEAAAAEAKRKNEELKAATSKDAGDSKTKKATRPQSSRAGASKSKSPAVERSEEPLSIPTRKGFPWPLLLLALVLIAAAYFILVRSGLR